MVPPDLILPCNINLPKYITSAHSSEPKLILFQYSEPKLILFQYSEPKLILFQYSEPKLILFQYAEPKLILFQYSISKIMTKSQSAGVPADLPNTSQKDYCLSQLAHLYSLQNISSLNLFHLHDRCHFLKHKFKNCGQLAWLQAFTSSFCKNSGKQNLMCDSVYAAPVNVTFSFNRMQITEHIRVP